MASYMWKPAFYETPGQDAREVIIDGLVNALERTTQTKDVQAEIAYLKEAR